MPGKNSPKGRSLALAALGVLLLAPAGASAAATITVEPQRNSLTFAPANVTRSLGEAQFTWIWGPNGTGSALQHDVVQNAGLFDSGETQTDGQFAVTASAGSFPYYCSVHFGMEARVAVRPQAASGYPNPFRVMWASQRTQTGRRFDVRYKVGSGAWKIWRNQTTQFSATFGARDKPVEVKPRTTYQFQARSVRTDRKKSGWSPALRVGGPS